MIPPSLRRVEPGNRQAAEIEGALGLGFLVAGAIIKKLGPAWSLLGYTSAGFVAVLAAVLTVLSLFDITPIAGARSPAGLFCQGLAGAAGGFIFHRLKPAPRA